jgi:hypothetical protein
MFPDPQALGEHHIHPIVGTPLSAAVLAGNRHMVSTLMDSPYRNDIDNSITLEFQLGHYQIKESLSPRDLASKVVQKITDWLNNIMPAITREDLSKLKAASDIMVQLTSTRSNPGAAGPDHPTLRAWN